MAGEMFSNYGVFVFSDAIENPNNYLSRSGNDSAKNKLVLHRVLENLLIEIEKCFHISDKLVK